MTLNFLSLYLWRGPMNSSFAKHTLITLSLFSLAACSKGSSGGNKAGDANPELQKPALSSTKETETCKSETTELFQPNDGEAYYQFIKSVSTTTRIVQKYENNVRTHKTEATSETSTCYSYQDHCNQVWEKDVVKSTADSVIRVTNPSPNTRNESTQGKMTSTLISTDVDSFKPEVGKSSTRDFSNSVISRIDGNKQFILEEIYNGISFKYNEAAILETSESETFRSTHYYLIKPMQYSESDYKVTTLKFSQTCSAQIEKVLN